MFFTIVTTFIWIVIIISVANNLNHKWKGVKHVIKYRNTRLPADGSDPFVTLQKSVIDLLNTGKVNGHSESGENTIISSKRLLQDDAKQNTDTVYFGYDSAPGDSTTVPSNDLSSTANNWSYAKEQIHSDHNLSDNEYLKLSYDPMDPMVQRREQSMFLNPLIVVTVICAGLMLFLFWLMQSM